MHKVKYTEVEFKKVKHLIKGDSILIVTANEIETNVAHENMKPLDGFNKILKVAHGSLTYYVGKFGKYRVAHIECSNMGSTERDASALSVTEALHKFSYKVVLMVGIAYGVNDTTQKIGDVIVAKAIQPYSMKRIGKKEIINRSVPVLSNKILFNRFRNLKTWQFLPDGSDDPAKLFFGIVLSGDELVDNKIYRNKLIKKFPYAIGGEMEGSGLYAACDGKACCILLKGISDYGDGRKKIDKVKKQYIAARASFSACSEVLTSDSAFKEFKVHPVKVKIAEKEIRIKTSEDVLFELYSEGKEKYYFKRKEDKDFVKHSKQYGLWIHGTSGCGKSNIILRNLLKNKVSFIPVSLATCIGGTAESLFNEILFVLSSYIDGVRFQSEPKDFKECINLLLSLLKDKYYDKELVIFIEEIPISNNAIYSDFAQHMFSLLIAKSLIPGLGKIRFILSSIEDPECHIPDFQQKIREQLKFIYHTNWNVKDAIGLIDLICKYLKIRLNAKQKDDLKISSKGSPRFIKIFFRNLLAVNRQNKNMFNLILADTRRDLNLEENG